MPVAKVEETCSRCQAKVTIAKRSLRKNIDRNAIFICRSCSAANRPQCTKEFWAQRPQSIEKIKRSLASSEKFKASRKIVSQKLMGEGNPMFGKSPSTETRAKMSESRTGKFGVNATAWKGGKGNTLLRRVKRGIYRRHLWAKVILDRDGRKCVVCSATKRLEAHHTTPFAKSLREVLATAPKMEEDRLLDWLIDHPSLAHAEGITVCRPCHREVHSNWGSHNPEIKCPHTKKTNSEAE